MLTFVVQMQTACYTKPGPVLPFVARSLQPALTVWRTRVFLKVGLVAAAGSAHLRGIIDTYEAYQATADVPLACNKV